MADIDLIPSGYRYWIWQLSLLKKFALGLLVVVAILLGLSLYWGSEAKKLNVSMAALQNKMAITQSQREKLERLVSQKTELERQWKLLDGLRGGITVENVLAIIDSALYQNEVWFLDWRFNRAGYAVEESEETVETGYFVVVPKTGANNQGEPETWKIHTRISINGQAKDHAAFSGFVQRLISRPEISEVKVEKTILRHRNKAKIVDFNIVVVVNNQ